MTNYIYDLLPEGKDRAIKTAQLMDVTGIETKRELCDEIRRERLQGALIISTKSNGGGYYRPKDDIEIATFVATFEKEAKSLFAMLKTARKVLKGSRDD